jgi:hypothetical protein
VRRFLSVAAIAVASGLVMTMHDALADQALAERCSALNVRLAKLNCKDGLREVETLLVDTRAVFDDFPHQLKENREGVTALASVLKQSTSLAQDCLVKHVSEKRPFDQAYIVLVELHSHLERWIHHKWQMPADFSQRFHAQLKEKRVKAVKALQSVSKTW